jgi:hypothetical protein
MDMIQLLVTETNKYYNQHLDTLDNYNRHSWLFDITVQETYVFLAFTIQIGEDKWATLKDYWSILNSSICCFIVTWWNRTDFFIHLDLYTFASIRQDWKELRQNMESKISLSDMLINTYVKFYSPSEHLAVDEVIVLVKGRVVLKQYICK